MARGGRALWLALVGCALWALSPGSQGAQAWLAPGLRSASLVTRRAAGFADTTPQSRRRKKPDLAQLEEDHGDQAALVNKILRGAAAPKPVDMVRARFSACKLKDSVFMAKTEKDPMKQKLSNRVRAWALCFGTEKPDEFDTDAGDASKLRELERLEIIEVSGNEVEFKLHCKQGVLLERSVMEEDDKYGWIYSGESKKGEWE